MHEMIEILELFGKVFDEYSLCTDYSGRGMFGRECVGICCQEPLSMLVDLTEYISTFEVMDIRAKLGRICSDSMGLDTIVYFPDLVRKKAG